MMKSTTFDPDWVSPPGDTISDLLEERGWTQAEFARRLGASNKFVNQLILGKVPLSDSIAVKLARVLGSSVQFWLNRESDYRAACAREQAIEELGDDVEWLDELPISDMRRFGWIRSHPDKARTVAACLEFFGVGSVKAWRDWTEGTAVTAFRMSEKARTQIGSIVAWLRHGELQAQALDCAPYSKKVFESRLKELRCLTLEESPANFVPKMQSICAQAGVAVAIARAPRGCPTSGATRWLAKDKALLMLSLRYKTNDHLWFTFFHEAGHILLHRKKVMFLEVDGNRSLDEEREADRFASEMLIPKEFTPELFALGVNKSAVRAFADRVGIASGVVVGRLQHEGMVPKSHLNGLKVRYKWT